LVDGQPKGIAFQARYLVRRATNVHEPTQTVREAPRFSAYLGQPFEEPIEQKNAYMGEATALLKVENIADEIIGNP